MDIGQANSVISIIYAHERCEPGSPCGQSISNKRPSRFVILSAAFVILSAAKDLSPDRDPSLRSELAQDAQRRDDTPEAASFDSQNVFLEMDWPLWLPGWLPSCQ